MRGQLELGVRYFDVRVAMNGAAVWTAHTLLMVRFREVLAELKAFCHENPTEVVVVKLREDFGDANPAVPVPNLVAELRGVASVAVPVELHGRTLGEMRNKGQIVFLADEEYAEKLPFAGASFVGRGNQVLKKYWVNSPYFAPVCEALRERTSAAAFFEKGSVEVGKINVVKCSVTLTPAAVFDIIPLFRDFEAVAKKFNSEVVLPFLDSVAGVKGNVGIAIETDYVSAEVVKKTIALNKPRTGSVVPLKCGSLPCTKKEQCASDAPLCNVLNRKCVAARKLGQFCLVGSNCISGSCSGVCQCAECKGSGCGGCPAGKECVGRGWLPNVCSAFMKKEKRKKSARCSSSRQCTTSCCSFSLTGTDTCKDKAFLRTCLP